MKDRDLEAIVGYLLVVNESISLDFLQRTKHEIHKKFNILTYSDLDYTEISDIVLGNSDMYCFKTIETQTHISRCPNSVSWFSKNYMRICYSDCFSEKHSEIIDFLETCTYEK